MASEDIDPDDLGDRIIIKLDPGGPIELTGRSDSFAALARIYGRHYRSDSHDDAPKLFITKLRSGSVIAEIAPLVVTFGQPIYQMMAAANAISGFTKRLNDGIRAFAGIEGATKPEIFPRTLTPLICVSL